MYEHTGNVKEDISIWEESYKIPFYSIDMKGQATLQTICSLFWETAGNHSCAIYSKYVKRGSFSIFLKNKFWVLSRLLMHIDKYPLWNDTIYIKTWMKDSDNLFAIRDFHITDENETIIGTATSAWLLIDKISRKPKRISTLPKGILYMPDRHGINKRLNKIEPLSNPNVRSYFPVKYSDIDLNNHVNNIKYVDWVLDTYPYELRKGYNISKYEINFCAENNYGDEISIGSEQIADNPLRFLNNAVRKKDNREVLRMRTEWHQNNNR